MTRETVYTWDVETVDRETDDILDHHFADRLEHLPALEHTEGTFQRVVLVRDYLADGHTERLWAYVRDATLPRVFEDAYQEPSGVKVPQRFHREVAAVAARFGV